MIEARNSRFFEWVFNIYISIRLKLQFRKIETIGELNIEDLPLLAIANHVSWWDGFWVQRLNRQVIKRRFHVMMLEEHLEKNMFLTKLGAFSLRKKSRSMLQTLDYASRVLANPKNMLLLFPNGGIFPQYSYPLPFENGWIRIPRNTGSTVQLLMIVHLFDYGPYPRPSLKQYVKVEKIDSSFDVKKIEEMYNTFYLQCVETQKVMQ